MSPQAFLLALSQHDWMPLVLMLSVLVRTWLTDKSAFPITLPVNWQPVVVAAATGFLNAVTSVQAGLPWGTVVASTAAWAASTGFLDGVLAAIWGDPSKAPVWGRFVVMAFDKIEGGKGGTTTVTTVKTTTTTPESTPTLVTQVPSVPPKPIVNERDSLPLVAWAFLAGAVGCLIAACATTPPGLPAPADISRYWADQNGCVEDAGTRAAADACRLTNRLAWCAKFPAAEDCIPADGGHE